MRVLPRFVLAGLCAWTACTEPEWKPEPPSVTTTDTAVLPDTMAASAAALPDSLPGAGALHDTLQVTPYNGVIKTGNTTPAELVAFAKTLVGIPYQYASSDPSVGFDCSGFVTYVFNHFNIAVPRSSVEFTNVGQPVPQAASRPGDLVLFTGTDSTETGVGHMGIIVTAPPDSLRFIHSTSGKANGVTVTPLNAYYQKRFVKVVRVF